MTDFEEGCECCGGWPIVLVQKCHPEAYTKVLLHEDGRIYIICAECEDFIVDFQSDLRENKRIVHESIPSRNLH